MPDPAKASISAGSVSKKSNKSSAASGQRALVERTPIIPEGDDAVIYHVADIKQDVARNMQEPPDEQPKWRRREQVEPQVQQRAAAP